MDIGLGQRWHIHMDGALRKSSTALKVDTNSYVFMTYEVGDYVPTRERNTLSQKSVTATQTNTVRCGEATIS